MLTVAEIRSSCLSKTYQRGRIYYQNGSVIKNTLQMEQDEETDSVRVTAEVKGSSRKKYRTSLLVTSDDEIIDYSCECPAYDTYFGLCKHCVALALTFQEWQKMRSRTKSRAEADIRRKTSEPLRQILYKYSIKNHGGQTSGDVRLDCYFQTDSNGLLLECKIGSRRMYVVKNLVKLVHDVEEMRRVRYGANLEFVHELSAFEEGSREIYQLIARAVINRYPDYQDSYYEYSNNFRYLLLRNESIEMFLQHFLGQTVRLDEQDIPVVDGNPPVCLTMKETLGGAELSGEAFTAYPGLHHTYVRKDGRLWRCSPEFTESVLPIWQAICRGQNVQFRRKPLFLDRDDYGSFCGNIVPLISPFVRIDSGSLHLDDYAPAEPEFLIYLGMPEDLTVEVTARVRYEEEEYDLMSPIDGRGACRNPEREREVRGILTRYFTPEETPKAERMPGRPRAIPRLMSEDGLPIRDLDAPEESETPDDFLPAGSTRLWTKGEDGLYRLLQHGLEELGAAAELYVDDSIRRLRIQPPPKVTMGLGFSGDLLSMDIDVEGMDLEQIGAILDGYRRRKKYFRLKNGDFLRLEGSDLGMLSEISEGLQLNEKELTSGQVQIPQYRALYLEGVLQDAEDARIRKSSDYKRLVRHMREYRDSDYEVPETINARLRRYQREGFQWLCTLYDCGFGGILADDMGLGKTLQIIAMFTYMAQRDTDSHFLVVAPASLLYNWESEIQRFSPGLSVQVIAGTAAERKEQLEHLKDFCLHVTSYDLLRRDISLYTDFSFHCCVLDEAQYIKNAATQAAKAVKQINARHRFALTGTPIENRLSDLWSIFDFLMPGYLFTYSKFREEIESPIIKSSDTIASQRLSRMATPFLLRRKKGDVLNDLPDKLEEAIYVRMTPEQERVYQATLTRMRLELMKKDEQEIRRERLQILSELTRLRQLCCSPELCFENYHGGSGKVDTCLEVMKNAVESGHRLLVFSQFTRMLELLQREWRRSGQPYLYLSGKDSKLRRQEMVTQFQAGEVPVFFISLKAGGTGLNLTAADVVIHCDPWWNVAAQNQATDRAHRIGQRRIVNVLKLVARDSIEEKILALQEKKAALADSVVEGEGVQDFTLNKEELMELFR